MAEDLKLPVKLIPDDSMVKKWSKSSPIISRIGSPKSLLSKEMRYEKTPKESETPTSSPINKLFKLYKIDLFWRWIKGSWVSLLKMSPIFKAVGDAIEAALGLIVTAGLLPFLPEIVSLIKTLLQTSAGILKWSQENTDTIRKFVIDPIKELFPQEEIDKFKGHLKTISELFDKLSPVTNFIREKFEEVSGFLGKFKPVKDVLDAIGSWIGDAVKIGISLTGILAPLGLFTLGLDLVNGALDIVLGTLDTLGKILGDITSGNYGAIAGHVGSALYSGAKGVLGFAEGGKVPGVGSSDTVPAMLTPGETVLPKGQTLGGDVSVKVFIDGKEFRGMIREEISKQQRSLFNTRGAVGI